MGRKIKRVPLDFNWPLNKVWEGFLNPHYKKCPEEGKTCFHGNTAAGMWLEAIVRLLTVAGENGKRGKHNPSMIWPHPYLQEMPTAPRFEGALINPTPELGMLTELLAGRQMSFIGHDSIDVYGICRKIQEAADLPETWGVCPVCEGHATDPKCREAAEAWEPVEPPTGPGLQLWETVSEGSPISPVFAAEEDSFADYLVIDQGYSRESVKEFIKGGWAPSGAIVNGVMYKDIESLKKI